MPEPAQTVTRIEVDRELCIGAASCIAVAPGAFQLDEENKAVVQPRHGLSDQALLEAAKACPVAAIYLYGPTGQRLYPDA